MNQTAAQTRPQSPFYLCAGLTVAALALAGFAHSYYLRVFFSARSLAPLVHLHGLLMTAWIALFVAQVTSIRRHRRLLHRRMGVAGAVLAGAMVIVGSLTVTRAIERRFPGANPLRFARIFVEFDGLSLWVFGALVGTAILWRARSDVHKRLMLAATVALLPPAVGRIAERLSPGSDFNLLVAAVVTSAAVLVCAAADTLRRGRMHVAMAYGAGAVVAANVITQLAQVGD